MKTTLFVIHSEKIKYQVQTRLITSLIIEKSTKDSNKQPKKTYVLAVIKNLCNAVRSVRLWYFVFGDCPETQWQTGEHRKFEATEELFQ